MGTSPTRKYLGLQVLRIVAASTVLITHSTFYVSERLERSYGVWKEGARGVDLFFVISGFVMVYSSTKLVGWKGSWKVFAWHRLTRIVPMYWIATTIKVVALLFTVGYVRHAQFSFAKTIESYLFLPSRNIDGEFRPVLGVGWTLNFEMLFYCIFGCALLLRQNVYAVVGSCLAVLSVGGLFVQPDWPAASFYLHTNVIEFFLGMLVGKACLANKHLKPRHALPLLATALVILFAPFPIPMWNLFAIALLHGAAAIVVYAVASLEDQFARVPRIILLLANASYVIYLFHPLVAPAVPATMAKYHLNYPWIAVFCCVICALTVGTAVHILVEIRITRWLHQHTPRWANRARVRGGFAPTHTLKEYQP